MAQLAPENDRDALGVSPALTAQGIDGPYGTALRTLVSRTVGPSNLVAVTFMARLSGRDAWEFGGFDRGEDARRISISGLPDGTLVQTVEAHASARHRYAFTPEAAADPAVLPTFHGDALDALDTALRDAGYAALVRIENPMLTNLETTDCASCHVAPYIVEDFDERWPDRTTALRYAFRAERESSTIRHTPTSLRAFGYFGSLPAITQRTANESHRVLARLAQRPSGT